MRTNQITFKEANALLRYDENTGLLFWKNPKHGNATRGAVGTDNGNGYLRLQINQKQYRVHRLIWLLVFGELPADEIDHINQIRTDNRIKNLREVSHTDNNRNKGMNSLNTSGFTGVCWHKSANKWMAQIMIDGKNKYLGLFVNLSDAVKARLDADEKYGFHQNHGT